MLGELGIDAEAADARITGGRQQGRSPRCGRRGRRWRGRPSGTGAACCWSRRRQGRAIEALLAAIDARLGARDEILTLEIPATQGRLLSWLHDNAEVLAQQREETGAVTLRVRIDPTVRGKFQGHLKRAGLA